MSEFGHDFVDALSVSMAEFDRQPEFSYLGGTKFSPLAKRLREAKDYSGLGRLYEAAGVADLALLHFTSSTHRRLHTALTALVLSAHWYRKGGENELAAVPARRALLEAEPLYTTGALRQGMIAHYHWYLTEMMADAAAVFDRELALRYYQEALDGFATVDETDEVAEYAEYFWGFFLTAMQSNFQADDRHQIWVLAKDRIPSKISLWLKA